MNDWATLLEASQQTRVEKVPAGYEPIWEVARKMNCSESHCRSQIRPLLGKSIDRRKFVVESPSGKVCRIYHYKQIK